MKKQLILLMALTTALLLTACGGGKGGEDSAHPYSWKEMQNGIRLTVQNAPQEGYEWKTEETAGSRVSTERLDGGTNNRAVFSVMGEDSGTVLVSCCRATAPYDTAFQIALSVSASENGSLEVTQADYQEFPPAGSAGEEGKGSCVWYTDREGAVKLYLNGGSGAYDWTVLTDDDTPVSLSQPDYDDENGCTYQLKGLSAGEGTVTLYDLKQDYGFRLHVTVAEDHSVAVTGGEAGAFDIPAAQVPGMEALEAMAGKLTIPQDVRVLRCRVGNWSGSGADNYGQLTLGYQETDWQLVISKAFSARNLADLFYTASDGAARTDVSIGGHSAMLYHTAKEETVFWSDEQGRSYALSTAAGAPDREALLRLAESLLEAQKASA